MKINFKKWLIRGIVSVLALVVSIIIAFTGWREYAQYS